MEIEMTTEYRNFTTDHIQWLLESNKIHLRLTKDTFLGRDDVDTILYNIEQQTAELVRRGVL
jgi:hypothetical protein